MNTRVQVEHPVTGLIHRRRHRAEQIKIAAKPEDAAAGGRTSSSAVTPLNAVSNAEDPHSVRRRGRITQLACGRWPWHSGLIRTPTNGYFEPPNYDSMVGKLLAYGATREQAIARMRSGAFRDDR